MRNICVMCFLSFFSLSNALLCEAPNCIFRRPVLFKNESQVSLAFRGKTIGGKMSLPHTKHRTDVCFTLSNWFHLVESVTNENHGCRKEQENFKRKEGRT